MFEYLRAVKKLVFSFSYFQATQFFRFRKEESYVHSSAGISSLLLRITIAISLFYNLVGVVQRQNVSTSSNTSYSYPPSGSFIEYENNFMVAFEMAAPVEGLQIFFFQNKDTKRSLNKNSLGRAQKCTMQHWRGVKLTKLQFKNGNMKNWLCMPKDLKILLQGARHQKIFSYLSIQIDCKNCKIPGSQIQLLFHFINPMINPSNNKDYLTYYIHSDYGMTITNEVTNEGLQIFMQDFTISSDTSILPWNNYKIDQGLIASSSQTFKVKNSQNSFHSQVIFKKSAQQTSYVRNFLKILDAFYFIIGSFAPTVVAFAFFIRPMLTSIFQMRLANCLYQLEEGKKYGVCDYIYEKLFNFGKRIFTINSEKWERVAQARQMLSKVMEVQYLYERLNFIQRSIKFLFKDHQLSGLRLMEKDSIQEANEKYRKYQIRKTIKKYIVNNDSQIEDNQHENIQQNKQYYVKTVNDFIKLRQEAQSNKPVDQISRMIYQQMKRKDIELMEQFQKKMKVERTQIRNRSQSMILANLQRQYQLS